MTTYYQIEWLVPRKNAIGDKEYWMPVEIVPGQYTTIDGVAALDLFKIQSRYRPGTLRLVRVDRTVIEKN